MATAAAIAATITARLTPAAAIATTSLAAAAARRRVTVAAAVATVLLAEQSRRFRCATHRHQHHHTVHEETSHNVEGSPGALEAFRPRSDSGVGGSNRGTEKPALFPGLSPSHNTRRRYLSGIVKTENMSVKRNLGSLERLAAECAALSDDSGVVGDIAAQFPAPARETCRQAARKLLMLAGSLMERSI
jgi:hypothetical protein